MKCSSRSWRCVDEFAKVQIVKTMSVFWLQRWSWKKNVHQRRRKVQKFVRATTYYKIFYLYIRLDSLFYTCKIWRLKGVKVWSLWPPLLPSPLFISQLTISQIEIHKLLSLFHIIFRNCEFWSTMDLCLIEIHQDALEI